MNFFKRIIDIIKSPIGRIGREPAYDWYFALYCFVFGFVVVCSASIFIFFRLTSNDISSDTLEIGKSVKISKEKIERAVNDTNQNDLNASSIPITLFEDPSER